MTAKTRSAAINFGRMRIRLPNQTGSVGRAFAMGLWAFSAIDSGAPIAGWIVRSETGSWVATDDGFPIAEPCPETFVAEASATCFVSFQTAVCWTVEGEWS
jgi:hypothetical protein